MIWRCPHAHCRADFGEDAIAFRNHMKGCTPQARREPDQTRTDDPRLADTSYEKRKFQEDVRRVGLPAAAERHATRTAYKSRRKDDAA